MKADERRLFSEATWPPMSASEPYRLLLLRSRLKHLMIALSTSCCQHALASLRNDLSAFVFSVVVNSISHIQRLANAINRDEIASLDSRVSITHAIKFPIYPEKSDVDIIAVLALPRRL